MSQQYEVPIVPWMVQANAYGLRLAPEVLQGARCENPGGEPGASPAHPSTSPSAELIRRMVSVLRI